MNPHTVTFLNELTGRSDHFEWFLLREVEPLNSVPLAGVEPLIV